MIRTAGARLWYLPPYSPDLNPIEQAFAKINALLRNGAHREGLRAKLFGGARISSRLRDVGAANASFAREYLSTEDIPCVAESLGGNTARRVVFRPSTGHARQLLVPDPVQEEVSSSLKREDVTLF